MSNVERKNWFRNIRFWLAVFVPAVIAVFYTYLAAVLAQNYGLALFVLTPLIIGFLSASILKPTSGREFGVCVLANLFSVILIGVLIMAFAIEGLVCLVMALPFAAPLIVLGTLLGYGLTVLVSRPRSTLATFLLCISMPFLLGFENSHKAEPAIHEVVSTVEINAPVETVWKNVIAFPKIDEQPAGILKLGFAYPIDARIDGSGVGAIRYCNFNTGAFVEPITDWQEPNLLAFDVREQPSPMVETTFYRSLNVAHLDYLRSRRGQFRLYQKGGMTVLEGTTFYTHDIAPDFYWKLLSDEIIHKIHLRVLDHIKEVSER